MTGLARALTVGRGIVERSTVGRLRTLRDDDALDGALVADIEEAFRSPGASVSVIRWTQPSAERIPTTRSTPGGSGR